MNFPSLVHLSHPKKIAFRMDYDGSDMNAWTKHTGPLQEVDPRDNQAVLSSLDPKN